MLMHILIFQDKAKHAGLPNLFDNRSFKTIFLEYLPDPISMSLLPGNPDLYSINFRFIFRAPLCRRSKYALLEPME